MSSTAAARKRILSLVDELLEESRTKCTKTKAGWCLREGMGHIIRSNEGALVSVVKKEGLPAIYQNIKTCRHEDDAILQVKEPQNCFQSLCRIVAGQQLSGSAVTAIWSRILTTTENNVAPSKILELAEKGLESHLQKPAGLSRAKARSIVALSQAFETRTLTESFLTSSSEDEIRKKLLGVKGIGPWSCDMFLICYLKLPDVFPVGDLGVRKGLAKLFSLHGKGAKRSLCPKKDIKMMEKVMQPYAPFRSIATYYMWKVADAKDAYASEHEKKRKAEDKSAEQTDGTKTPTKSSKKRNTRQTTP